MRQVVLDTETTGISVEAGHRIIEIGCLELINRKLTGRHYHQYINPQREIEQGALEVHGITQEFLQNKPVFSDIAEALIEFLKGAELIIHNAPFDVGFINYELGLAGSKWKSLEDHCDIIDTLVLARKIHVGQRNSLDALCKRYNVDNSQRDLHGALLDANLLTQVYLAMTGGQGSLFGDLGVTTENTAMGTNKKKSATIAQIERKALLVISANEIELAENEKKLQEMAKNGKCLWLES